MGEQLKEEFIKQFFGKDYHLFLSMNFEHFGNYFYSLKINHTLKQCVDKNLRIFDMILIAYKYK